MVAHTKLVMLTPNQGPDREDLVYRLISQEDPTLDRAQILHNQRKALAMLAGGTIKTESEAQVRDLSVSLNTT